MRPNESFINQPVRSLQTMLRVIAEDDPRFPTVVPDGIYGDQTITAVTAFQRQYGLPQNGIVDQDTWGRIVTVYESALIRTDKAEPIEIIMDAGKVYRIGDTGPYIYLVQSLLIFLSENLIPIPPLHHSGIFDDETQNALIAFQRIAGLSQTGELDKITWKHLSKHFTSLALNYANRQPY